MEGWNDTFRKRHSNVARFGLRKPLKEMHLSLFSTILIEKLRIYS